MAQQTSLCGCVIYQQQLLVLPITLTARPLVHAQLDEGAAEIFGAELERGVSVNVAGQKVAVSFVSKILLMQSLVSCCA